MTQRARTSISHAPTRSLTAPNAGRPACPTAESQRGEQGTATLGEDAAHECDAADRAVRRHLSTPSCHCGAQARESYRSADPAHRPSFPRPASRSRRVAVSSSGAALCAERVLVLCRAQQVPSSSSSSSGRLGDRRSVTDGGGGGGEDGGGGGGGGGAGGRRRGGRGAVACFLINKK